MKNVNPSSRSGMALLIAIPLLILLGAFIPAAIQQFGLDQAEPIGAYLNGTLPEKTPSSTTAWTVENAYPNLIFTDPLQLIELPGTNRFLMAGKKGKIWTFDKDPQTNTKQVVVDIESQVLTSGDAGLMGVAVHPEFHVSGSPNEGYFYVWYRYKYDPNYNGNLAYLRLSRFRMTPGTYTAPNASEFVMIQQYDRHQWHNGGGLFFDPEGLLYITVGDEGGANDQYNTGQKINVGLLAGVLRIDVDQDLSRSHTVRRQPLNPATPPSGWPGSYSQGYTIPDDNPWQDPNGSILEEFYAIGLRSPHRMTYDEVTGDIWVGDIGQGSREEISRIIKGGNYQWPYREGEINGPKAMPNPLIGTDENPFYAYPRSQGTCVIGGFVYRGSKWASSLGGLYLFGDHTNRNVWTLDPNSANPQESFIVNVPAGGTGSKSGISSFATDSAGEVYILKLFGTNLDGGTIYKLKALDGSPEPPALLSQTDVFKNLQTLEPEDGLIPYDLNVPFWSDGAYKFRWMAIPNDGTYNSSAEQIVYSETGEWQFPIGTVLIKHFEYPVDDTDPTITRRLETRLMVHGSDGKYYGVTYRWRPDQSDAELLAGSWNEVISVNTATGSRNIVWEYPDRQQCLTCHNDAAGKVLGPKTRQLNGERLYTETGRTANQITTLEHLGIFSTSVDTNNLGSLLTSASTDDTNFPLELRARSYIDANCSYCHRPGNPIQANFDARLSTPLANAGIINGSLVSTLGLPIENVVYPGDTSYSVLYKRAHSIDPSIMMPPIAKNIVDVPGTDVIAEWIMSLDSDEPCSPVTLNSDGFESGWGIWSDGGSDAARINNGTYASSGSFSLRLRDNTSTSVITTHNLDLSDYSTATVDFAYQVVSFDNSNEDFWLQLSTDGGSSFTTVEEWNRDDEFVNNQAYTEQVEIAGPFTTQTQFRFRCDASGNQDWVYLDDITLTACESGGDPPSPDDPIGEVNTVSIADVWTTVSLSRSYINPVVVAGAPTYAGSDPTTVRVRNITANSFEIRIDEWDCLDGTHVVETVPYLVVEAGVHTLPNGSTLMAGNIGAVNQAWLTHNFPTTFNVEPVVFAQCVTENEADAVSVRIDENNTNTSQIRVKLKEEDKATGGHANETVSWIAVEPGSGTQDMVFEAGNTGRTINHNWEAFSFAQSYGNTAIFFGGLGSEYGGDASTIRYRSLSATGVEVFVEEEACGDTEVNHTTEEVHFLVFDEPGDILTQSSAASTARVRQQPDISWMSVHANPADNMVLLDWTLTSEQEIEYYQVDRSTDGQLFLAIHQEPSRGNTDHPRQYQLLDQEAPEGTIYYRITAIGRSRESFPSPLMKVSRELEMLPTMRISPNRVQPDQAFRLELKTVEINEPVRLQFFDLSGRVVHSETLQDAQETLVRKLTPALPPGIYLIRATGKTWELTERILIQ